MPAVGLGVAGTLTTASAASGDLTLLRVVRSVGPANHDRPQLVMAAPPTARVGEAVVLHTDVAFDGSETIDSGLLVFTVSGADMGDIAIASVVATNGVRVNVTARADGLAVVSLPASVAVGDQPLIVELDVEVTTYVAGPLIVDATASSASGRTTVAPYSVSVSTDA